MRNIKLTLAYDGTAYSGWQSQKKGERTVQDTLKAALEKFTGNSINPIGSGRTDAGVHALCLVVSFKTTSSHDTETIARALNALLPQDIRVTEVKEADTDFHPLRGARLKRYSYLIDNTPVPSPFLLRYAWHVREPLDIQSMDKSLMCLMGEHDFRAFMASGSSVKTTVRRITEARATQLTGMSFPESLLGIKHHSRALVRIDVTGTGFLKQMVRNIVGTAVLIGQGKLPPTDMLRILEGCDRRQAGPTAPAHGLYLAETTIEE